MRVRVHAALVGALILSVASVASAQQPQVEAKSAPEIRTPSEPTYPNIKFGGYAQLQYTYAIQDDRDGSHDRDTLSVRSAVVNATGQLTRKLHYRVQAGMNTPGGNTPLLEDLWVEYEYAAGHVVRVGQMYTLFGLENPMSAAQRLTVNRSHASALGRGPDVRDIGVALIGKFGIWDGGTLNYGITGVNGAGRNVDLDKTPQKDLWSRAYLDIETLIGTFTVGGSFGYGHALRAGDPDTEMDDRVSAFYRVGSIAAYKNRFFTTTSEVIFGHDKDKPEFNFTDEEARGLFFKGPNTFTSDGGYVLTVVNIPYVPVLGRVDWINPDRDEPGDRIVGMTAGAYYDIEGGVGRLLVNYDHAVGAGNKDGDRVLAWLQAVF